MSAGSAAKDFVVNILGDSTKADKVMDAFGKNAGKIALGAAAAVAGANIGKALNNSLDISEGRAMLTAQLGLTSSDADTYSKIAGNVWAGNFGESLGDVNLALRAVSTNIGDVGTIGQGEMKGLTEKAMTLESVFGEDLTRSTAAVGTMLKSGLADNATEAFDILTTGFQTGTNKAEDLLDTFTEYSVQFVGLGLNGEQSIGLMNQALDGGARNADVAADALKEFFIRAKDATAPTTVEGFKALGLNAEEMAQKIAAGGPSASAALQLTLDKLRAIEDPVARAAVGVQLFGTKSEDMAGALTAMDLSTATDQLGNVEGATQKMVDGLGAEPRARIASMKRELDNWVNSMLAVPGPVGEATAAVAAFGPAVAQGATVLSPLAFMMQGPITQAAAAAKGGFTNLADGWKNSTAAASAFSGKMGTLGGALRASKVVTIATAVASGIATAAQWAWNAALTANPIGLIIVAIVALVGALVWFFTQTELGKEVWTNVMNAIGAAATWLWESVIKPVFDAIGAIWNWLYSNVILPVITGIMIYIGLWAALITWLWTGVVQPIFGLIGAMFTWIWNSIIMPVVGFIVGGFQLLGAVVAAWWSTVVSPVFTAVGAIFTWIWNSIIMPVAGFIVGVIQGIGAVFSWLWANAISPAINAVATGFNWVYNSIILPVSNFIGGAIKTVGSTVQTVFGGIASFIGNAFQTALGVVKGPLNAMIDLINGVINGLNSIKVTIPDWIPIVGGNTFGLAIPRIPKLANGGVSTGPTLALIGDNPGGQEVVEPLAGYKAELQKERDAVANAYAREARSSSLMKNTFNMRNGATAREVIDELEWMLTTSGVRLS